jgi:glycine dehydrogenase subunit 1
MRYLPLDAREREAMLSRIGVPDIEALFADILPTSGSRAQDAAGESEMAVERAMKAIAGRARRWIGSVFCSKHRHIPATVDHLIQRSEFDQLHALSAGIAQGAAGPIRIQTQMPPCRMEVRTPRCTTARRPVARRLMAIGSRDAMLGDLGGLHPHADVCATLAHMAGDKSSA